MSMHPEYPALIREALASDTYWDLAPKVPLPDDFAGTGLLKSSRTELPIIKDKAQTYRIGSLLASMEVNDPIESIANGEEIPIPNSRQIVKIVEDSRKVCSKLAPEHHLIQLAKRRHDYKWPSFEKSLETMYGRFLTEGPPAQAAVSYSLTKLALIERAVFYAMFDEERERFVALSSTHATSPQASALALLHIIPRAPVGSVYVKDKSGRHTGRIVTAELLSPSKVVWRNGGKGSEGKPKSDRRKLEQPSAALHGALSTT